MYVKTDQKYIEALFIQSFNLDQHPNHCRPSITMKSAPVKDPISAYIKGVKQVSVPILHAFDALATVLSPLHNLISLA